MTSPTHASTRRPSGARALRVSAVGLILVAASPQEWLIGVPADGDPHGLVLGSWIFRVALLALAAFLALAPRFEVASDAPPDASSRGPGERGALLAALVAATLVRVYRLDAPLWFDEIWMLIDSVRPPLAESVRTFASDNDHPLYSLLASLSVRVFGEAPWALRLPAAAFGVACVWAVFAFARDRLGPRIALGAAWIVALAPQLVSFSQNARGYSGLLFFTVASSHFFLRALETGRRRHWIGHGLSLAFCVTVHLTGVFTAFGHVAVLAWVAWRRPKSLAPGGIRAAMLGLVLSVLATGAAYALIAPQVVQFFLHPPAARATPSEAKTPLWFLTEAAAKFGMGPVSGAILLVVGAVIAGSGLRAAGRRMPELPLLLVAPAVSLGGAMVALHRNLWPRLFFFLAGFAVVAAVVGMSALARAVAAKLRSGDGERAGRRLETAVVAVAVAACAVLLPREYALPKQDYGAALDYLKSHRRPDEAVVTIGMAGYVYHEYYGTDFIDAKTPDELARAIPPGRAGYVVYTMRMFLKTKLPEVWEIVDPDRPGDRAKREVARFRGSIGSNGDGDVVIVKLGG